MAECHPVGFQWVDEAKARGAKVIHVDPRFTRTSAVCDKHIPIRAGSDVVLLGALINHVLTQDLWFKEYVRRLHQCRDADQRRLPGHRGPGRPVLRLRPRDRTTTTRRPGLTQSRTADRRTRHGASDRARGRRARQRRPTACRTPRVLRDETLQHPRTVFQILKRHYARYTPEMVRDACGISIEDFDYLARTIVENSGRDRTTCFAYAVGWTQHTLGAQFIRTATILQLLLGNVGRPGSGIMALRGHASIQGSTDIPTLFNLLPGYLPMPTAGRPRHLRPTTSRPSAPKKQKGFWANADAYIVSLLKAWWGEAAREDNDWAYDYLPRMTGPHGTYQTVDGDAGRRRRRATSCWARTRPSVRPTAACSGWACRT